MSPGCAVRQAKFLTQKLGKHRNCSSVEDSSKAQGAEPQIIADHGGLSDTPAYHWLCQRGDKDQTSHQRHSYVDLVNPGKVCKPTIISGVTPRDHACRPWTTLQRSYAQFVIQDI